MCTCSRLNQNHTHICLQCRIISRSPSNFPPIPLSPPLLPPLPFFCKQVCDQPHPGIVRQIVELCAGMPTPTLSSSSSSSSSEESQLHRAQRLMTSLFDKGYASSDIITTVMRVVRSHEGLPEVLKVMMMRVIAHYHLRMAEGVGGEVQMLGCIARMAEAAKAGL